MILLLLLLCICTKWVQSGYDRLTKYMVHIIESNVAHHLVKFKTKLLLIAKLN
jgi:hypothetical protein